LKEFVVGAETFILFHFFPLVRNNRRSSKAADGVG
jgi:hypothetical protein